jgi:drug/metabolite transporter (DMT)-like permease
MATMTAGLPFFRIYSSARGLAGLSIVLIIQASNAKAPLRNDWMWMVARACFGTTSLVSWVLAARVGASPGDVASIASSNGVMAALIGRYFLNEDLKIVHGVALCLSFGGAVLITRPALIFGGAAVGGDQILGYMLAVLAGFAQAGAAICCRKGGDVSAWYNSVVSSFALSFALFLLPCTPFADEGFSLEMVTASPVRTAGVLAVLWILCTIDLPCINLGSKICPAAVSATCANASQMVTGYLAQILIFSTPLLPLTIVGAFLMLAGAILMSLSRAPADADVTQIHGQASDSSMGQSIDESEYSGDISPQTHQSAAVAKPPPLTGLADDSSSTTAASSEDETESLVSFIACEFARKSGSPKDKDGVKRRQAWTSTENGSPAADMIGAVKVSVALGLGV